MAGWVSANMRLTQKVMSVQSQILNFGPFSSNRTRLFQIYLGIHDTDGEVGEGQCNIQASIVESQATTNADVSAGQQLLGFDTDDLDCFVGTDGSGFSAPFNSPYIPIFAKTLAGKYIAIRLTMTGSSVSGWIGIH